MNPCWAEPRGLDLKRQYDSPRNPEEPSENNGGFDKTSPFNEWKFQEPSEGQGFLHKSGFP